MSVTAPGPMARRRRLVLGLGALGLIAGVAGLLLVEALSDDFEEALGISNSALVAIEETLVVVETVTDDVDEGLAAAGDGVGSASQAAEDTGMRLGEVADFLDGELQANLEAIRRSMPAAVQAAGAIDDTLSALSLFGVDYDPEEPFDVSLMGMQDALSTLSEQLSKQAEAVRGLVPTSERLAEDAAVLSDSLASLSESLAGSRQLVESYRATLEQAREALGTTESDLGLDTWLLRLVIVAVAGSGIVLSLGLIIVASMIRDLSIGLVVDETAGALG